jgi:hypothetical protein
MHVVAVSVSGSVSLVRNTALGLRGTEVPAGELRDLYESFSMMHQFR